MISPSKKDFLAIIKKGKFPPLYEEIPYSSPSLVYESLAFTNSFLLESVKGHEKIARHSFIGFEPCLVFKVKNGIIEIETSEIPPLEGGKVPSLYVAMVKRGFEGAFLRQKNISSSKPLNVLKNLVKTYRQKPFENLPPFQGGIAGILSYDFAQYFERLPNNSVDDLTLPDAHFLMIDKLIAFDHLYKMCWIIVCPGVKDMIEQEGANKYVDWSEKYDEAEYEIQKILKKVSNTPSLTLP